MTLQALFNTEWHCISDHPKVGYPYRAPELAACDFQNEHGVAYTARVVTNRTEKRWWLLIVGSGHWLRLYLTTTSPRRAAEWVTAVTGGWV